MHPIASVDAKRSTEEPSAFAPVDRTVKKPMDGFFSLTNGDVAQLGEHRLCKAGVVGSIPIVSIPAVRHPTSR